MKSIEIQKWKVQHKWKRNLEFDELELDLSDHSNQIWHQVKIICLWQQSCTRRIWSCSWGHRLYNSSSFRTSKTRCPPRIQHPSVTHWLQAEGKSLGVRTHICMGSVDSQSKVWGETFHLDVEKVVSEQAFGFGVQLMTATMTENVLISQKKKARTTLLLVGGIKTSVLVTKKKNNAYL